MEHRVCIRTVEGKTEVTLDGKTVDAKAVRIEVYPGGALAVLSIAAVIEADILTPVELGDIFPHG